MPGSVSHCLRIGAIAALAVAAGPGRAQAFCGFFVAGSNAKLTNNASQVVLMRKGNRTVMTMSNNYRFGVTQATAAKGLATAPRGAMILSSAVRSPVPSLGIAGRPKPQRQKAK
jgi:hypothetical protein